MLGKQPLGKIEIAGIMYNIINFMGDDGEDTTSDQASCLLLQNPEEARPEGVKQNYKAIRIKKGSMSVVLPQ